MVVGSTAETQVLDAQVILPLILHRASAERVQFKVLLKRTKKNPGEDPATEQSVIRHLERVTDREKNWGCLARRRWREMPLEMPFMCTKARKRRRQ